MRIATIIVLIIIGALANRSAGYIYREIQGGFAVRLAIAFPRGTPRAFLTFYVIAGLPIAFVNGLLLRFSWIDCVVVGVGTWVSMLASIVLARRFNPVIQFYLFAGSSLLWLIVDAVRAFSRDS
jgi:hypothetical protein